MNKYYDLVSKIKDDSFCPLDCLGVKFSYPESKEINCAREKMKCPIYLRNFAKLLYNIIKDELNDWREIAESQNKLDEFEAGLTFLKDEESFINYVLNLMEE